MTSRARGFTLVEVLVVVAIVGILTAIAAVSLIGTLDRARQRRTMADLHTLAVALESYDTDHGFYPRANSGAIAVIANVLEPTYVRPIPTTDGWASPILYRSSGTTYTLASWGADRAPTEPWPGGITHHTADDIVLIDGQFFQWPEGSQNR